MKLTNAQTALIDKHLRSDNWLLNKDLIAELTDHYQEAITTYMAGGKTFDEALRLVHTDFGGRKGLLAMEENFIAAQHKEAKRLLGSALATYLRWPRLLFTLVATGLIAYLSVSPIASYFIEYGPTYVRAAAAGHFTLLLLTWAYKAFKKQPSLLTRYSFAALYFGYGTIIFWMDSWLRLLLGKHLSSSLPVVTLSVLIVILYEAAVIDYLGMLRQRTTRLRIQA